MEVPISKDIMISTLVKQATVTIGLDVAWGTWTARAAAGLTMGWGNAVTHPPAVFASKVELAKITGVVSNRMNNQDEEEMVHKLVVALENLANANVGKNGTIETLFEANLALVKAVTNHNTSLLAFTTAITNLSNQRSKGCVDGGGGRGNSS